MWVKQFHALMSLNVPLLQFPADSLPCGHLLHKSCSDELRESGYSHSSRIPFLNAFVSVSDCHDEVTVEKLTCLCALPLKHAADWWQFFSVQHETETYFPYTCPSQTCHIHPCALDRSLPNLYVLHRSLSNICSSYSYIPACLPTSSSLNTSNGLLTQPLLNIVSSPRFFPCTSLNYALGHPAATFSFACFS